MTRAELLAKIKAEIERRIKSIDSCPFIEAEFGAEVRREGKLQAYKDILSFLDTLEEPVSDCHDLEEAVEKCGTILCRWRLFTFPEYRKGITYCWFHRRSRMAE